MCCFSGRVSHVGGTRIFARAYQARQALAYQMEYAADAALAMVLPLPTPPGSAEDAVRFLDLSGYREFFDRVEAGFEDALAPSRGPVLRGMPRPQALLAVHEVGDFEASFVPTVADFERLDARFRLPAVFFGALPQYADWGFAVFRLKPSRVRPAAPPAPAPSLLERLGLRRPPAPVPAPAAHTRVHPMALDFPTRAPGQAYFPCVHLHDGAVHAEAEFDHTLYLQPEPGAAPGRPGASALRAGRSPWLEGATWERAALAPEQHLDPARTAGLVVPGPALWQLELQEQLPNADVWVGA